MSKRHKLQLIIISILFGLVCFQLFSFMLRLIDEEHYARQRIEVTNELGRVRLLLEQTLNSTFYITRGLEMLIAGLTADGTQLSDHWQEVRLWAAEASADLPYITNIGVAEGYILKFAYPLKGNEKTIGLDYRSVPDQWLAVERAIRTGQPVVAGPLELIQGGVGIVCRIPLYADKYRGAGGKFVGIVSMVVDYEALLEKAGLEAMQNKLTIAIKGRDGLGAQGELFFGDPATFEQSGVQQIIEFLGGEWVIAAKPLSGWSHESPHSANLKMLGYVIGILGAVLLYLSAQGVIHRFQQARIFARELEQRVDERTRELSLAKDEAEKANRAKSEFLAVVTHELRTPLNSIIGLTDLILDMELGKEQRQFLEKVATSATLLLELINNILSYSKIESGKDSTYLTIFSLHDLLRKITDLFAVVAAKKGLEFYVDINSEVPLFVRGDEAKILQVLVNLCGNALKFTGAGEVRLRIEPVTGNNSEREGTFFRFIVHDTGIGISEEDQALLFQPFSQVDSSSARKYPGTGLGLSICKRFVDLMGGTIGVDSRSYQGSRFWFEIPLQIVPELPSELPARNTLVWEERVEYYKSRLAGLTVILAEDNEFNQALAVALLHKVGFEVKVAANGLEVLKLLECGPVHGVLMDVQMPEMDGLAATEAIRRNVRFKGLPVIAMTANAMDEDRERVLATGMDRFIAKPIDSKQLYQVLEECLDRSKIFPSGVGQSASS